MKIKAMKTNLLATYSLKLTYKRKVFTVNYKHNFNILKD